MLTVRDLARWFKCHHSTIYRWIRELGLPFHRIGGRLLFDEREVLDWVKNHKVKNQRIYQIYNLSLKKQLTKLPPLDIDKAGGNMATTKKGRRRFVYGSIYQRKPGGNWTLDYKDRHGKRVQKVVKHATCWEEAHEALRNAITKEFLKSQGIPIEREPVRFDELADMYIESYAKVNKKSWKSDMYRIDAHMRPFFSDCETREITALTIEKYRAKRLSSGVTRTTVNKEATILKKMFNLAMEWKLMDENPCASIKMFSEQGTQRERVLTEEEESKLLAECPHYLRPIILAAIHTGMRRGEILNLKWGQIDLEERTIKVEQTKNGRNRMIPINEQLHSELLNVKSLNGGGDYVFPNPATNLPYSEVKKSFKTACKATGVDNLRFHDLRHTFASRLVQKGADIITVRDLLGHFSVRVTQRYTHSNHSQMKEAVELLAKGSWDKKN